MGQISRLLLGCGLFAAACTTPLDDPGTNERLPEEPWCPPAHVVLCPDSPDEECCQAHELYGYSDYADRPPTAVDR